MSYEQIKEVLYNYELIKAINKHKILDYAKEIEKKLQNTRTTNDGSRKTTKQ